MLRKLLFLLVVTAVIPCLLFAATGKIHGKVTDAGTGEALVGANVLVVGSSMGAATDANGEYNVLNVEVGTYQVRCTYVGYQTITISNLRVNSGLTTEGNFSLPAEGVTVSTVEITAERPLINKNATNAVRIIDSDFFTNLPAHGTGLAVTLQPGVVQINNAVYVRGSRPDELGYRVDGVTTNNALYGGQAVTVSQDAVEQIQVQAGGFNAEYGGANAGLVQTQLKTGSPDRWKASFNAETDRYTSYNSKSLGGYSYGYSSATATLGGPLEIMGKKLRLFGSVENTFYRDPGGSTLSLFLGTPGIPSPLFVQPFNYVLQTKAAPTPAHPDPNTAVQDTITLALPGGHALGGLNNRWTTGGTALLDLGSMQVRASGSYSYGRYQDQTTLANMLNSNRLPINNNYNGFAEIRFSHVLNQKFFYEAKLNYFTDVRQRMDPDLLWNVFGYGDSAANAAVGYHTFDSQFHQFAPYGIANYEGHFNFQISQPGSQVSPFSNTKQFALGGSVDFTAQMEKHEIKFGGEYTRYTVRRYAPGGVFGWAQTLHDFGSDPAHLAAVLDVSGVAGSTGSDIYGYDIYGNQIENDVVRNGAIVALGPRHPVYAGLYVQDKIELSDIIMNLGLRYDYIDPNSLTALYPGNLTINPDGYITSKILGTDISNITLTPATKQVSPRVGFSFPVTDRTTFHFQYGKFIQQTELRDSYLGMGTLSGVIRGGLFVTTPAGWGLKPTRTTQYEIGFSQQVSDASSFDITAFYKDIQDQVQYTYIIPDPGTSGLNYPSFINGDFATTKGVEFKVTLRRTNRISAQINYTFSDAATTGSNPATVAGLWSAGTVVDYPKYVFPSDFDIAHKGSFLFDYRFASGDGGPVLENLGLNVLAQFNSGHPFTREVIPTQQGTDIRKRTPVEAVGASTTPWFFQIDARIDKSFRFGPTDFDLYVYVINILNTQNAVNVNPRTGDPRSDGWFTTAGGITEAQYPGYQSFYNTVTQGLNAVDANGDSMFGPPRQIRFGIKLDY